MFRRLTRHFAAGLVDNDLIADGQDLHASIAGIVAAFLVGSACVALMFLGKYNSVVATVHGRLTAQFQILPEKLAMALDDKTLLIGGAMILMGLVTAIFWDSLALDERDLAVMGPLPVRPAVVLAAKGAAVTGAAAVVAVALNALPSLLFPIVVLLKAPVGPGDVLRAMGAHAVAGLAGCAFVFLTLSSIRGFAGLFKSGSVARRLLPIAQFALVLGFLSVLFALPVLAGRTRTAIEAGADSLLLYPPLWFLGLEEVLIGRTEEVFVGLARAGVAALAASLAAACLVHTCALLLRAHRIGAGAGSPTSMTGHVTPGIEQFLIDRTALFYAWVGLFVIVVGRFVKSLTTRARRDEMPVFDEPAVEMEQLGLWNTVHSAAAVDAGSRLEHPGLFQSIGREPGPAIEEPVRSWGARANQLWLDIVYAQRRLRASPGFTAFSVITLALGIGATTALHSVIYSTILKPLNARELDRLVNIYHADPMHGNPWLWSMSWPDFEDLRKTQTVFSVVAAHAPFAQIVIAHGAGEKARGEAVNGDYFSMLGIQPAAGRLLQPADDRPGAAPVAVIDDRMWRRRFDRRPDIAGQIIRMAGRDFEIVGVAPADFHGVVLPNLAPSAVWVPLEAAGRVGAFGVGIDDDIHGDRDRRWLMLQGRLAPGHTIEQANAELRVIGRGLDEAFPLGVDLPNNQRSPPAVSRPWLALPAADRLLTEQADPGMLRMARLTMVAVTLVLLVACTNLANLTLARGVSRRRDLAVRLALGASRWQVVREQLVESTMLALLGAFAALAAARALAVYGSNIVVRLGAWVSVEVAPALDVPSAVVGVGATAVALVVFGLVPALQLTSDDATLVGGTGVTGGAGTRWRGRRLLIASQVAVSVALVAIASLCTRHVVTAASRDTGLDLDRLALVRFDFKVQGWTEARARRAVERIADEARRQDGTEAVAIVSGLPLLRFGGSANLTTPDRPFAPPGYYGQGVTWIVATPQVFRTLGLSITAGRSFDERDSGAAAGTVVLSARAARDLFDTTDVVGRQLLRRRPPADGRAEGVDTLTVIGVADDTPGGPGARPQGTAYAPFSQTYEPSLTIAARTARSARAAVARLENLTHRIEPELGVIDAGTGTELSGVENLAFEIMGALSGMLGVLAMALAMAGLYGVLSYVVAQRTHEIGVRVALGASTKQIMRLILIDGVRPVVEGLAVGFVIADLAEMAMRPALVKPLPAIDATLMVLVPLPFLIAALVACYLPSRRAAGVDPNVALRHT